MTGYKGRVGLYEAITVDKAIQDAVYMNPSDREISEASEPQNILTLQEDGIQKVLAGVSTLEELERVVDLEIVLDREHEKNTENKPQN